MKKLLALLLILSILFSYTACSRKKSSNDKDADQNENVEQDNLNPMPDHTPTIVVPEYKDYGRGTLNFSELVYSRPDIQAVINAFNAVTNTVSENNKPIDEQITNIKALEDDLSSVKSMYSLAEIYQKKDSSVEFWQDEYEYISTNYPKLSQAVEDLLVACARSEHKVTFEISYFHYSLDEYVDGGMYTDEVVALMEQEADLEAKYSSFSTANVEIVYKRSGVDTPFEGTVDEVLAQLKEYFGNDEKQYEAARNTIVQTLYKEKLKELEIEVYVDLLKVRRLIADELGFSSYSQLAYKSRGYDYTESEMLGLLGNVGKYVAPVAFNLEYMVFYSYFLSNVQPTVDSVILMNTLYKVYSGLGGDYADAYSYMLQHGLYDVADDSENRFSGAFTAYIDDNSSPYIFMSASGFIRDYSTLAHEFGHFYDGYVNYGDEESLTVAEISSQSMELLTLLELKGKIKTQTYEYLEYYTMYSFLNNVILNQSFYSLFEHMAYSLSYDEISKAKLEKLVSDASSAIYGESYGINNLSYVVIPHTVLYPFYVESYVTSGFVSLDIFFAESSRTGREGDGFNLYARLVNRGDTELSFSERLEYVGIDSPFESEKTKEIANNIFYQITGKYYYKNGSSGINAA